MNRQLLTNELSEIIEPRHGHRVVAAAIKLRDGLVICVVRHLDELMRMQLEYIDFVSVAEAMKGHEQGFVDNKYQFLTRAEAYKVALAASQFDPNDPTYTGSRGTLYSEDLW